VSYKRTPPPPISMYQNILFSLLIEVVPLCGARRLSYFAELRSKLFCLVSLFLIFNIIRGKSQHFPTSGIKAKVLSEYALWLQFYLIFHIRKELFFLSRSLFFKVLFLPEYALWLQSNLIFHIRKELL